MGRLQEVEGDTSIPPTLALMTDSSEEDEEIEEQLLYGSQRSDHCINDLHTFPRNTRGRFVRMVFLKNKTMWFVWDPCGIVCAVFTYILILYGQLVMLTVIAPPFPGMWTVLRVVVFLGLAGLAVVAHVRSMFTDPVS